MTQAIGRRAAQDLAASTQAGGVVPAARRWVFALGMVFVLIAVAASGMLVVEHFGALSLPGCGPGGACEQAAKSVWGKIPGIDWPNSFLGLAYFLAALAGWIATRGALPGLLRWVARLGVVASLGFIAIIVTKSMPCPYCIAAHIGNFGFWLMMELTRGRTRAAGRVLASVLSVFALASAVLGLYDGMRSARLAKKAEAERKAAAQQIIAQATTAATASAPVGEPKPFTGRYRRGPEAAPIRIMMYTDFQCRDCRQIEQQVLQVLAARKDVSLSMKHFPFCMECNPRVQATLHPNACWAARAAEAAGILWGDDGFWKMHDWLFARSGVFETNEEISSAIRSFGYEPQGFFDVMKSAEVQKRIRADAEEAAELGLFFTPMIFINGVELKGWYAPNALVRTIEEVAASNPPARTAAYDQPPRALDKYVADWRDEPVRQMPPDAQAWTMGPEPATAAVQIVVWGDYQEEGTAEADAIIRDFVRKRGGTRYTFRHFPFDQSANALVPFSKHLLAGWAARAAEAAGAVGGSDGFWRMHIWLMSNRAGLLDSAVQGAAGEMKLDSSVLRDLLKEPTDEKRKAAAGKVGCDLAAMQAAMQRAADAELRKAAGQLKLDADAVLAAMAQPAALTNIKDDVDMSKRFPSLRWGTGPGINSIPSIFINGRYVPRWKLNDKQVLDLILNAAAAK